MSSADNVRMPISLPVDQLARAVGAAARGAVELVIDAQHHRRVVLDGILKSSVSLDIATADFKAMLVPQAGRGASSRAVSIVEIFRRLASRGVEIRLLHAGTPSAP